MRKALFNQQFKITKLFVLFVIAIGLISSSEVKAKESLSNNNIENYGNNNDNKLNQTDKAPSYIKDKISISIGMGLNSQQGLYQYDRFIFSVEGLYGLNNFLEAGVYFSYLTEKASFNSYINPVRVRMFDYGVKGRVHIIPIIKPSFKLVDVYANLELGGHSVSYDKKAKMDNYTKFSINGGGGIIININKAIGVFYECNYSNIYKLNHKYGMMFRF